MKGTKSNGNSGTAEADHLRHSGHLCRRDKRTGEDVCSQYCGTWDDAGVTLIIYPSDIRTKAVFTDAPRASAVATHLVDMGHIPFLVSKTVEYILGLCSR